MTQTVTPEVAQLESTVAGIECCAEALDQFVEKDDEDRERASELGDLVQDALGKAGAVLALDRNPTENELHAFWEKRREIESLAVDMGVLNRMPH